MTLLEPLDPTTPAQLCFWCFQFLEPISCTFCSGQCELGSVSLELERTLALPSLFSLGPTLWKRGIIERLQDLSQVRSDGTSSWLTGSQSPQALSLSAGPQSSILAAPRTPSQSPLWCGFPPCSWPLCLHAFDWDVALTPNPYASAVHPKPLASFRC